jgi:hypothetical protein
MSVKTSKCLFLWTFGFKFEVYNTEMKIYGQMTVKHLFIIQATVLTIIKEISIFLLFYRFEDPKISNAFLFCDEFILFTTILMVLILQKCVKAKSNNLDCLRKGR